MGQFEKLYGKDWSEKVYEGKHEITNELSKNDTKLTKQTKVWLEKQPKLRIADIYIAELDLVGFVVFARIKILKGTVLGIYPGKRIKKREKKWMPINSIEAGSDHIIYPDEKFNHVVLMSSLPFKRNLTEEDYYKASTLKAKVETAKVTFSLIGDLMYAIAADDLEPDDQIGAEYPVGVGANNSNEWEILKYKDCFIKKGGEPFYSFPFRRNISARCYDELGEKHTKIANLIWLLTHIFNLRKQYPEERLSSYNNQFLLIDGDSLYPKKLRGKLGTPRYFYETYIALMIGALASAHKDILSDLKVSDLEFCKTVMCVYTPETLMKLLNDCQKKWFLPYPYLDYVLKTPTALGNLCPELVLFIKLEQAPAEVVIGILAKYPPEEVLPNLKPIQRKLWENTINSFTPETLMKLLNDIQKKAPHSPSYLRCVLYASTALGKLCPELVRSIKLKHSNDASPLIYRVPFFGEKDSVIENSNITPKIKPKYSDDANLCRLLLKNCCPCLFPFWSSKPDPRKRGESKERFVPKQKTQ